MERVRRTVGRRKPQGAPASPQPTSELSFEHQPSTSPVMSHSANTPQTAHQARRGSKVLQHAYTFSTPVPKSSLKMKKRSKTTDHYDVMDDDEEDDGPKKGGHTLRKRARVDYTFEHIDDEVVVPNSTSASRKKRRSEVYDGEDFYGSVSKRRGSSIGAETQNSRRRNPSRKSVETSRLYREELEDDDNDVQDTIEVGVSYSDLEIDGASKANDTPTPEKPPPAPQSPTPTATDAKYEAVVPAPTTTLEHPQPAQPVESGEPQVSDHIAHSPANIPLVASENHVAQDVKAETAPAPQDTSDSHLITTEKPESDKAVAAEVPATDFDSKLPKPDTTLIHTQDISEAPNAPQGNLQETQETHEAQKAPLVADRTPLETDKETDVTANPQPPVEAEVVADVRDKDLVHEAVQDVLENMSSPPFDVAETVEAVINGITTEIPEDIATEVVNELVNEVARGMMKKEANEEPQPLIATETTTEPEAPKQEEVLAEEVVTKQNGLDKQQIQELALKDAQEEAREVAMEVAQQSSQEVAQEVAEEIAQKAAEDSKVAEEFNASQDEAAAPSEEVEVPSEEVAQENTTDGLQEVAQPVPQLEELDVPKTEVPEPISDATKSPVDEVAQDPAPDKANNKAEELVRQDPIQEETTTSTQEEPQNDLDKSREEPNNEPQAPPADAPAEKQEEVPVVQPEEKSVSDAPEASDATKGDVAPSTDDQPAIEPQPDVHVNVDAEADPMDIDEEQPGKEEANDGADINTEPVPPSPPTVRAVSPDVSQEKVATEEKTAAMIPPVEDLPSEPSVQPKGMDAEVAKDIVAEAEGATQHPVIQQSRWTKPQPVPEGRWSHLTPYVEGEFSTYPEKSVHPEDDAPSEEQTPDEKEVDKDAADMEPLVEDNDDMPDALAAEAPTPALNTPLRGSPVPESTDPTAFNSPAPVGDEPDEVEVSESQEPPGRKRYFRYRKLRDPEEYISALENYEDMSTKELYDMLEAINLSMVQWQQEWNGLNKVVDDYENSLRRRAADSKYESRTRNLHQHGVNYEEPDFAVKGYKAKEREVMSETRYLQSQDRIMAATYGFEYDPHPSKIGRQNPATQQAGIMTRGRSLRNQPRQTAKATEADEVTGKRQRKPVQLFDPATQDVSRSSTPVPTRGRRRRNMNADADEYPNLTSSFNADQQSDAEDGAPRRRKRIPRSRAAVPDIVQDLAPTSEPAEEESARGRRARTKQQVVKYDDMFHLEDDVVPPEPKQPRRHLLTLKIPKGKNFSEPTSAITDNGDSRPSSSASDSTSHTAESSYSFRPKRQKRFRDDPDDLEAQDQAPAKKRGKRNGPQQDAGGPPDYATPEVSLNPAARKVQKIKVVRNSLNNHAGESRNATPSSQPAGEEGKDYKSMTKSEKMSASMKSRWANGNMAGAVEKRKATLAAKKAAQVAAEQRVGPIAPRPKTKPAKKDVTSQPQPSEFSSSMTGMGMPFTSK
ncbi:hypothetical protein B0I35DRAFT_273277 [Stachybotrys elegans]|uniref:Uncharacterized protein n=1 Tax=Stachybotrys elegans TaxID=80388 RepID=A0A8K0WQ79_9HYPO|nr:hypothetical protein B0I35DRAFT_273277 [Stachybotrys elegans]